MMGLRAAVRFLTVLPAGGGAGFDPAAMAGWFPAVGLILGAIVAAIDIPAHALWGPAGAAAVDVVLLAALSGALHLDGLGDTADGLFSHRSRERALEIMKDSRIGAMGVVAIVGAMLLKWAGIAALGGGRTAALLLVPAYGRAAALLAMRRLPYARPEGGTGRPFFDRPIPARSFWGLALVVLASGGLGGRAAFVLNAAFFAAAAAAIAFYRRRMGGVTGDMLGALIEAVEAALFLAAAAAGGPA